MTKKTIALIFGGKSGEHDVSIKTAFSILNHINYDRYDVLPLYITTSGEWSAQTMFFEKPTNIESLTNPQTFSAIPSFQKLFKQVDIAFPVVHGPNGEDGTLQGFLELMQVPYVGCGVVSSALGMDKVLMKKFLSLESIPQCEYVAFSRREYDGNSEMLLNEIETKLGFPAFVKPANLGSSVGISKVKNKEDLQEAISHAFSFDNKVIVEETVTGREIEIGVLGNYELSTSVIGEVVTNSDFYDYESKYENEAATELIIPTVLPADVKERVENIAKKVFTTLECSGLSRIDFFYNEETDKIYVNEINTMPGFTSVSMYPMLFAEKGVSYPELIETLLTLAEEVFTVKQTKQTYIGKP